MYWSVDECIIFMSGFVDSLLQSIGKNHFQISHLEDDVCEP